VTRVKICCIASVEEAEMAVRNGAQAVGLVSEMPSGPGVIDEALIAEIAAATPRPTETFLLTSLTDPQAIAAQHRRCGTTTIQLVDRLPHGAHAKLRAALPNVNLVQVVHVKDEDSVAEALEFGPGVDAILLDSGKPDAGRRTLGGTGDVHDWSLSARIVKECPVPVWLAGGLNPDNVAAAVQAVQPFGVDLCSGVRTNDQLEEEKLARFMKAVP
jgi:phosphoribosylanthranilate isomerase